MNLSSVIYYMKSLGRRGFLATVDSGCGKVVLRELTNSPAIKPSDLQPVDIYKCYR
jgi:hypothetical protein